MSKIISIANQKGGVGKTTTAVNVAACLCEAGKKVLLIDMDPQGNATSGMGFDRDSLENTVYDLLLCESTFNQTLLHTDYENLDLIPSDPDLAAAEKDLLDIENKEYILKSQLAPYKKKYDYIVIDCPPTLNTLTLNALSTSDGVIIPVQCEFYALVGLTDLLETIELVSARLNSKLKVNGIVFTMFDGRTASSIQIVNSVKNSLQLPIYSTMIPRNVRLSESPSFGEPIIVYESKCAGAIAYRNLTKEILAADGFSYPEGKLIKR